MRKAKFFSPCSRMRRFFLPVCLSHIQQFSVAPCAGEPLQNLGSQVDLLLFVLQELTLVLLPACLGDPNALSYWCFLCFSCILCSRRSPSWEIPSSFECNNLKEDGKGRFLTQFDIELSQTWLLQIAASASWEADRIGVRAAPQVNMGSWKS